MSGSKTLISSACLNISDFLKIDNWVQMCPTAVHMKPFSMKERVRRLGSTNCHEYTLPRDDASSQPKGWIQGNMRIGPVLEVTTSFQNYKYGIEIRIWSVGKDNSQSWVRISYGTPLQTQRRSSVRNSHPCTTQSRRLRHHSSGSSPMSCSLQHTYTRASRHSSRIRFPGNALVHTSAGFVAVSIFSSSSFLFSRASSQPESSQTNMFRRNAVATASRVINDTLTVCRNCDAAIVPKIQQLALDYQ